MSTQVKYDMVDLIIRTLKDHEKTLDALVYRLEEIALFQEMQTRKSF